MSTIYTVHADNNDDSGSIATIAAFTTEAEADKFCAHLNSNDHGDSYWVCSGLVYDTSDQKIEVDKAKYKAQQLACEQRGAEEDEIYELASIEASELDSPNSPGYGALHERISERIYSERHPS